MLKKQLLLLILLFSFSSLWADELDNKYNLAIKEYKSENYEEAQELLQELADVGYGDTDEFIYFLLGRTGRHLGKYDSKQDDFEQHNLAITNFEKYLEYDIPEKNEIATKINLAYEYASGPPVNKEVLLEKSKEMVEELKSNSQYKTKYPKLWKDVLYCYSTVLNKYAFYLIEKDDEVKQPRKYYVKIEKILQEAIKTRDDNVPAVGNLAYVYFRIMEFNLKNKNKNNFDTYYELVEKLIEEHNLLGYQDRIKKYLSKLKEKAKNTFKS